MKKVLFGNVYFFWKFEVSGVIAVNPVIQISQVSGVIAVKMSVFYHRISFLNSDSKVKVEKPYSFLNHTKKNFFRLAWRPRRFHSSLTFFTCSKAGKSSL